MRRPAGIAAALVLAAGGATPAWAAAPRASSIGGTVWIDDGDGLREPGEVPAAGVRVEVLRRAAPGAAYRRVVLRSTDARGRWTLRVRATAAFRVVVALPSWAGGFAPRARDRLGLVDSDVGPDGRSGGRRVSTRGRPVRLDAGLLRRVSGQAPAPVAAADGDPGPSAIAAQAPGPDLGPPADGGAAGGGTATPPPPAPVTIGDRVWRDLDDDGEQDAGEPGEAGVRVELWKAAGPSAVAAATTAADGGWAIAVPSTTTAYRVRLVLPPGAYYARADAGGDDATDSDVRDGGAEAGFTAPLTVAAATAKVDAGVVFRPLVTLGDRAWRDLDADGRQGQGEPACPGEQVEAWNANRTQRLAATTTDAAGHYALAVPRDGTYRLRFAGDGALAGFSPQAAAGDAAADSDPAAYGADAGWTAPRTPAADDATVDAGCAPRTALGDRVWRDLDADGVQDPGEPGVPDVTVQLTDAARTTVYAAARTDAAGAYGVLAPFPGTFRMRVLMPGGGVHPTDKDAGGDDAADSDVVSGGALFGYTDAFTVTGDPAALTNVDAGLVPG